MNSIRFKVSRKSLAAVACVSLAFSGMVATPASAQGADGSSEDSRVDETVRYIEAGSAADAQRLQDKVDGGVSPQAAGVDYGPCELKTSNVWKRKSTQGAGSKPVTECTENVTSIHHKSQLAQRTALLWWKVKSTNTGGNKGVKRYEQKNLSAACKSDKDSVWRASTTGTIVFEGKTYYATKMTASYEIPCRA